MSVKPFESGVGLVVWFFVLFCFWCWQKERENTPKFQFIELLRFSISPWVISPTHTLQFFVLCLGSSLSLIIFNLQRTNFLLWSSNSTKGYIMKRKASSQQTSDLFSRDSDYLFIYPLNDIFCPYRILLFFNRTRWAIWNIVISTLLFLVLPFFFLHHLIIPM